MELAKMELAKPVTFWKSTRTNARVLPRRAERCGAAGNPISRRDKAWRAGKTMNCKEVVKLVTDYLEGNLPLYDHIRFEDHLRKCPGCELYLDQMRQTVRTLGRLTEDSVPAAAKAALLVTFRNWQHTRQFCWRDSGRPNSIPAS
jgi:hypothetical protein